MNIRELIEHLEGYERVHGPRLPVTFQGAQPTRKFALILCTHRYPDGSGTARTEPELDDRGRPQPLCAPVLVIMENIEME